MIGATPDLRLFSQLQSATFWPGPDYTTQWQRHMGVKHLPGVVTVSGLFVHPKFENSSSHIFVLCRVQPKCRLLPMIIQAPCRCQIRWSQVARIQPPVRKLRQAIIINPAVGRGSRMKLLAVGILTPISHIFCLMLTVKVITYVLSLVFL